LDAHETVSYLDDLLCQGSERRQGQMD